MKLPDFLGIGTQKGGTTYLHSLLSEHPQAFLAIPKELHFFSLHYQKGLAWYRDFFKSAADDKSCGEITPYYMFHPLAFKRIHKHLPDVKLIVLLRDPVERAISQFFHSRRLGLEPLGFKDAFAVEEQRLLGSARNLDEGYVHISHQQHSYLSRSRYDVQLKQLLTGKLNQKIQILNHE